MYCIFKLLVTHMAKGKKTGGRVKGTPNKPKPLKEHLRAHSTAYFEPKPQTDPDGTPRKLDLRDKDGNIIKTIVLADANGSPALASDFEVDMMLMEPKDRAIIQEKLLRYHTPQMQSVSAEVSMSGEITATIGERLKNLAAENDG